jgi:YVTN family beta-propeller protein
MSIAAAVLAIGGCNIDGKYTVGGTVTGLVGQGLVLEDNSGNSLSLSANGAFVFSGSIGNGDAYSVTVATQPSNPAQTCTVHNGSGTIDKTNVLNVLVSCTQPGRFAYVANQGSNDLSAYVINSSTGLLTPVAGSPFASQGTTPVSLTVDPNGLFLYVVDNASNDVSVYSIDNSTGTLAAAGVPIPTGTGPFALTVDPTDTYLYVANFGSNTVSAYTIDSSTGQLTELSNSPFAVGSEPTSLKIDPSGNFLYVTNYGSADVTALAIDSATGSLSGVSGSPFGAGAGALSNGSRHFRIFDQCIDGRHDAGVRVAPGNRIQTRIAGHRPGRPLPLCGERHRHE